MLTDDDHETIGMFAIADNARHNFTDDPDDLAEVFSSIMMFKDYLEDCVTSYGTKRPIVSEPS